MYSIRTHYNQQLIAIMIKRDNYSIKPSINENKWNEKKNTCCSDGIFKISPMFNEIETLKTPKKNFHIQKNHKISKPISKHSPILDPKTEPPKNQTPKKLVQKTGLEKPTERSLQAKPSTAFSLHHRTTRKIQKSNMAKSFPARFSHGPSSYITHNERQTATLLA